MATAVDLDRSVALFHALSDATRLAIIEMLREGERCVCELQTSSTQRSRACRSISGCSKTRGS